MILTGYIDGLEATLSKSREREKKGDVSEFVLNFFIVLIKFAGFLSELCTSPTVAKGFI